MCIVIMEKKVRGVKLFLIISLSMGIVSIVFLGIYAINTLNSVELNKIKAGEVITKSGPIRLDSGGVVNIDDLKTFFLFSNRTKSYDKWIEEESGNVEKLENSKLLLKKNFYLNDIFKNSCKTRYCYQHRINFENIPSVFWRGLIGVEDIRFLDHIGIDFKSILRALIADIKEMKKVQGGSTLTQQIVKNLFFTSDKTISRKVKEAIVAIYIEWKFSKEDILEAYFNEVYWGTIAGVNIKGIYASSIFYFGKTPSEINAYEASILISLLKGPNYYHPIRKTERLKKRASVVFNKLVNLNLFSLINAKAWTEKQWDNWVRDLRRRVKDNRLFSLWWTSEEKKIESINSYQKFILKNKALSILRDKKKGLDTDLSVKMIIGDGKNHYSFYSKYERDSLSALTLEKHQIGSTIKPIVYSLLRDLGKKWEDETANKEITLSLLSGKWSPKNSGSSRQEVVSMKEALQQSINRPLIRISQEIGFEKIEKGLESYIPEIKKPLGEYPSQLLGSLELTMLDLYSLYLKFIENECSKVKHSQIEWESSVLSILSDPSLTTIRNQVGSNLKNSRFFGKTGTTNDGNDNWFVFFDGKLTGVIWFGNEGKRDGTNLKLYGSTTSFRIFKEFMTAGGKRVNEFSCPEML